MINDENYNDYLLERQSRQMVDLNLYKAELIALCRSLSVKRLSLVGSAVQDDFLPESSDKLQRPDPNLLRWRFQRFREAI